MLFNYYFGVYRWLFVFSEYYFSLPNLERDFFLRRKMDSKGFLPISLIASFHRVQALTTDISLIKEVTIDPSSLLFPSLLSLGYYICFLCVWTGAEEQWSRGACWWADPWESGARALAHPPSGFSAHRFFPAHSLPRVHPRTDVHLPQHRFWCVPLFSFFLLYLGLFCSVVLQLYCYFAWFWKGQPWL